MERPLGRLRPQADYECANVPAAPSQVGDVLGRVQQMRDPHVFQDGGKTYLFYAICGEQGVAAAEIQP